MASVKRSDIERTERQSASLKRELRLPDLVLLQVLLIVGLPWIGYAAKLGGSHVVLWMAAIALFYFPLAGTVIYLSRRFPVIPQASVRCGAAQAALGQLQESRMVMLCTGWQGISVTYTRWATGCSIVSPSCCEATRGDS